MGIGRGRRARGRYICDMGQGTREEADVVGIADYPKVLCSNGSQTHYPKTASILNESLPLSLSLSFAPLSTTLWRKGQAMATLLASLLNKFQSQIVYIVAVFLSFLPLMFFFLVITFVQLIVHNTQSRSSRPIDKQPARERERGMVKGKKKASSSLCPCKGGGAEKGIVFHVIIFQRVQRAAV